MHISSLSIGAILEFPAYFYVIYVIIHIVPVVLIIWGIIKLDRYLLEKFDKRHKERLRREAEEQKGVDVNDE